MKPAEVVRVFVGYDTREPVAYHVCCESIIKHTTMPVQITPLALNTVRMLYEETHTDGSNQFIYSRFLVPWLCDWQGHAIFLDGDMLLRGDITRLWQLRHVGVGVQVVKHDYKTKYPTKYLGAKNEDYPAKNWSSVVLWNCGYAPHRCLTPEFVSKAAGSYLHRFEWLKESAIGSLPLEWNHLVSEYPASDRAWLAHFTIGTPAFSGYEQQEFADEWYATLSGMIEPLEHVF